MIWTNIPFPQTPRVYTLLINRHLAILKTKKKLKKYQQLKKELNNKKDCIKTNHYV